MIREERLNRIIDLVNQKEILMNEELMDLLGVSAATIRRDINDLAEQGRVEKVRGGVVSNYKNVISEPSYIAKSMLNLDEKKRIGRRAAEKVENGERIALDSGSTCLEMARALGRKSGLGIVTNDMLIAMEFMKYSNSNNSVIVAGGLVRQNYYASYGSLCEDVLQQMHVQKAFISTDALDVKRGLMSYTTDDVRVKQLLIEIADDVTLLCDHTKFESLAYISVAPLKGIRSVITGKELPDEIYDQLCEKGIHVERV